MADALQSSESVAMTTSLLKPEPVKVPIQKINTTGLLKKTSDLPSGSEIHGAAGDTSAADTANLARQRLTQRLKLKEPARSNSPPAAATKPATAADAVPAAAPAPVT